MARPVDRDLDEVRARLADWTSGRIARNAAVEIHKADWRALGLQPLDRGPGQPGADRQRRWLEDYLAWITPNPPKLVADGLAWLAKNEPPSTDDPALCWGDCRLANQIFRD